MGFLKYFEKKKLFAPKSLMHDVHKGSPHPEGNMTDMS